MAPPIQVVDDAGRGGDLRPSLLHDVLPVVPLLRMARASQIQRAMALAYNAVDAKVNALVFGTFDFAMGINLDRTESTHGLPLVESPTPLLLAVLAYLAVVALGVWRIKAHGLKPRQKEPRLLQAFVLLHNFFLCSLSIYMCVGITLEALWNGYTLWGNPYKPAEKRMAFLIYLFYVSKFVEFGDTLIMVAKRSIRQISFLHLYHHSSIAAIWWTITYHAPGGDAYFSAALNSGVHVVMYGYYFLAAALGKDERLKKKYLFWGRYVTQMQMLQFVLNMMQSYWLMKVNRSYPMWLAKLLFYYMVSLLTLFGHFYVKKYIAPRKTQRSKSD